MVKVLNISSISDAEQEEIIFWKSKSFEDKLSTVQFLREQYINLFNKQDE
jgi:hypothetical protein